MFDHLLVFVLKICIHVYLFIHFKIGLEFLNDLESEHNRTLDLKCQQHSLVPTHSFFRFLGCWFFFHLVLSITFYMFFLFFKFSSVMRWNKRTTLQVSLASTNRSRYLTPSQMNSSGATLSLEFHPLVNITPLWTFMPLGWKQPLLHSWPVGGCGIIKQTQEYTYSKTAAIFPFKPFCLSVFPSAEEASKSH